MATTYKILGQLESAATTLETLYTVPASTTSVVTEMVVANTAGTAATFTLNLKGTAMAGTAAIAANSTTVIDIKQVLNTTETITGSASATTVKFFISGVEIA